MRYPNKEIYQPTSHNRNYEEKNVFYSQNLYDVVPDKKNCTLNIINLYPYLCLNFAMITCEIKI